MAQNFFVSVFVFCKMKKNKLLSEDNLSGEIVWTSPANIAIVKYWGKYGVQLPRNPNISFTLEKAVTSMRLKYSMKNSNQQSAISYQPSYISSKKLKADSLKLIADSSSINLDFHFTESNKSEKFRKKIVTFLSSVINEFPFLTQLDLRIDSENSFPHSAGIASSASSMSALALCLCSLENRLTGNLPENSPAFFKKASRIARLASGSACRSVYPEMALWGKMKEVKGSSNLFAIDFSEHIHLVFKTYHDAILIASTAEKDVSSRRGHGLMNNNAYATPRYKQARERMQSLLEILKSGDTHAFGQIAEDEAMTLHALMMTCSPSFTLLKPNTLRMIEILRTWRQQTNIPAYFSLDAGPNLHLLFPNEVAEETITFIETQLKPFCENEKIIYDRVGKGREREKNPDESFLIYKT